MGSGGPAQPAVTRRTLKPMPIWPFRRTKPAEPPDPDAGLRTSALAAITDATPHRFRIWVAEPDAARVTATLAESRLARELTVTSVNDPDERGVGIELASTFSPRTAAILRPLHVLDRAGVTVVGLEELDHVTDVDDEALAAAVAAWGTFGNQGPHRHRLEVLAGATLLERCLAHLDTPSRGRPPSDRAAWLFAATCVAVNTDGAEPTMLEAALATTGHDASSFVDPVVHRAEVARLTHTPLDLPVETLARLIRRSDYVSDRAAYLAQQLPAPLANAITDALCDAAMRGGERSERAIAALANAAPTEQVRTTLNQVLASEEAGPMANALGSLAAHWPDEARPVWRRFLASRSVPLRWAAEETLGQVGTEADVPEAAAHLAKLVRTKSSTHFTPPRGADLIALLLRHPEHADAQAGLEDLTARWDRLNTDLHEWLEEHHPELAPDAAVAAAELSGVTPEEPGTWPPPTIERDGDAWMITFSEGADHSPQRDRFEELVDAAPGIQILDGDREWLRVRIRAAASDAKRILTDMWEEA